MKKLITLVLVTAILSLSLISCDLSFFNLDALGRRDEAEETVVMYGVGTHIHDLDHTCVYFASSGHMVLPRLKSGEEKPEFEVGDLIRVTFTTDKNGIPIMESFPGQFGAEADEIVVKEAEVDLYYLDNEFCYGDAIPDGGEIAVGETYILFTTVNGERKDVAEGEIIAVEEGTYSMKLLPYGEVEDVIKYRFEYGLSLDKK